MDPRTEALLARIRTAQVRAGEQAVMDHLREIEGTACIGQGPSFRDLGNAVSDAIFAASGRGMALDEACCVVVAVAADYARGHYGDAYLDDLADVVRKQRNQPLPKAD